MYDKKTGENVHRSMIKPQKDDMQFRLVVKLSSVTLLDFQGHPRRRILITAQDMADAFTAEQIIEKLVGIRVHLLEDIGEAD